jgi:hypothetical protein
MLRLRKIDTGLEALHDRMLAARRMSTRKKTCQAEDAGLSHTFNNKR